jgi:cathepsin B
MFKLAVLSFLVTYVYAAYYDDTAPEWISKINANEKWRAGINPYLKGKSLEDMKRLMGTKLDRKGAPPIPEEEVDPEILASLPTSFTSGVDKWPKCGSTIGYIKDQADCGSCWAVAASAVVGDRTCIGNYGKIPSTPRLNEKKPLIDMSAEQILSCCSWCGDGCQGGYPIDAMKYWAWTGVVTGGWYGSNCGCQTYGIPPCPASGCSSPEPPTPKCSNKCGGSYSTSYNNDKHYASDHYEIKGAARIQQEIYQNGPVECAFQVYENFMHYSGGVYDKKTGSYLGGHAITVIGWGTEGGEDYWLINNSWNVTWGVQGQFKFLRGTDLCGMESQCVGGKAKAETGTAYLLKC